MAYGNRYGYHRDELYFRAAARHPALGYDDQGPITPLLGWVSEALFGESPRGLRVFSAVVVACVVVLVALVARELGAGAGGQLVAAAGAAAAAFVLAVGHLLTTSTFDMLVWIVILLVVARILGGGDERLWLVAGLAAGLGLENKQLPLLLVGSLAIGFALDRRFAALRSPWLWSGVVIAVVLWLPNLVWQGTHGWPQLELASDIRRDDGAESRLTLIPFQLLLVGPLLAPVLALGLWDLLRDPALRPWRSLGIAYLALLVLVFATAGKPYYTAPFLLCLLAAGSVGVERWLATRARQAATRARSWSKRCHVDADRASGIAGRRAARHSGRCAQRGRDRDGRLARARARCRQGVRLHLRRGATDRGRARGELRGSRGDRPLS